MRAIIIPMGHIRPKPCCNISGRVALLDRVFEGSRRRGCVGHGSARRQGNKETTKHEH
jgi:hypothetical protein